VKILNLIVVAHPDDEILGIGATGAKLVARGEVVQPVILCGDVHAREMRPEDIELAEDIAAANKTAGFEKPSLGKFPNIQMNAVPHIEIVEFIEKNISEYHSHRVFTHHPADLNDDHRQVARACLAAFRLFQRRSDVPPPRSLHFMEIQSATDWAIDTTLSNFRPNLYVEVSTELDIKLEALKCYRNVMREYPHPRSEEAIRGLAAYRGAQSGQCYSEAFETVFQRDFA
jgi:LmbE family N-acetylglucosaminyl deacetylase